MNNLFKIYQLENEHNLFNDLYSSVKFEILGKGRVGTVLVKPDGVRGVPIVRTTTNFSQPAICFGEIHDRLVTQIQAAGSLEGGFNNALIESYTNDYTKMGFHTDLALDLEPDSHIALYSCYKDQESTMRPRSLIVESKDEAKNKLEIPLTHDSVVIFSVDSNQKTRHKIILSHAKKGDGNPWLGITFRRSATYVQHQEESVQFENGTPLTLADDNQKRAFFPLRRRENREVDFSYPTISYTISESDLMPPASIESEE